ncbi:MAG: hypothetical protein AAFR55_02920 [Pseudomonadota bacterium]
MGDFSNHETAHGTAIDPHPWNVVSTQLNGLPRRTATIQLCEVAVTDASELLIARPSAGAKAPDPVRARLEREHGDMPCGGCAADIDGVTLIALSADRYLALSFDAAGTRNADGPDDLAAWVDATFGADVVRVPHADARFVVRLAGEDARAVLARGCGIDVHARAFAVGTAASTAFGHIPLTLWRLTDDDGDPAFCLATPRSYCGAFVHDLTVAIDAIDASASARA